MEEKKIVDRVKSPVDKRTFAGKNKLYVCDLNDGKVRRVKPIKEYLRAEAPAGKSQRMPIQVSYYVMASPMEFYISTDKGIYHATSLFQAQFDDTEKKLREQIAKGEFDAEFKATVPYSE